MVRLSFKAKTVLLALCLALVFSVVPVSAMADDADESAVPHRTVRVGYMLMEGFQEGTEGERKFGYGYDYLQQVANYTGWNYEYVYGTFEDLMSKLKNNEIDLMGYVAYTPERAEYFAYPELPQGRESFYIYTNPESKIVVQADGSVPSGLTIGVRENSYHEQVLAEWIGHNQIDCTVKHYPDTDEMHHALQRGEVDGIVSSDFAKDSDCRPLAHIGFEDFYLVTSVAQQDTLNELNEALYQIYSGNRYINSSLYAKYYNQIDENVALGPADKEWLALNGNTIRLGYLRGNLPYSTETPEGNLQGSLSTLAEILRHDYGINVKVIPFSTREQMLEASKKGEIDLFGPLFADYYMSEMDGILNTNPIMSTTLLLLHREETVQTTHARIAYAKSNAIQYGVLKGMAPHSELIEYSDKKSCIESVANGETDYLLLSSAALNIYKQFNEFDDLHVTELNKKIDICMGVRKDAPQLLSLINKVILSGSERLSGASFIENAYVETTLADELEEHAVAVTLFLLVIIVVLASFVFYYWKSTSTILRMQDRNATLSIQAFRDELTMTGNQSAYLAEEGHINDLIAQDRVEDFGLVVVDINALKYINDNYGHEFGDTLIKNASSAVARVFAKSPVFRIGGDEFAVILRGDDLADSRRLTDRLSRLSTSALSKDSVENGAFSLSWGFSAFNPETDRALSDVFERADKNMYACKKEIKKTLRFS